MRLDGYLLKDIDVSVTPTRDEEIFRIFALFLVTYVTVFSSPLPFPYFYRVFYLIFLNFLYILLKQSCLIILVKYVFAK